MNQIIPAGAYSVSEATTYIYGTFPKRMRECSKLHLNTRHLHWWIKQGLSGGYLGGYDAKHSFINFYDLITMRVIATLRAHGIKHREIVQTDKILKKQFGWQYPFAMAEFWSAVPNIFIKIGDTPVAASRYLQSAMDFFTEYMKPTHGLTFDLGGLAGKWEPKQDILLDPQIQFGEPCISGTRIPTQVLWSFHEAGDSVDSLAYMYVISSKRIKEAIDWEDQIQKATKQRPIST
ncbi:DUF433 domain-containing protein [Dehalogenimonas sp. THU2]|uniref:DUF433 domain-containing protein n=1 Tax=Dehalogenimonas sp. THU2 TaxID=3151121 RepID=UPI0032181923